jgi:hypothetical protein
MFSERKRRTAVRLAIYKGTGKGKRDERKCQSSEKEGARERGERDIFERDERGDCSAYDAGYDGGGDVAWLARESAELSISPPPSSLPSAKGLSSTQ